MVDEMTTLYLIRHGQASFGSADYDRLSPLGIRQATIVGHHLALVEPGIDSVVSGTLRRQIDSTAHAVRALGKVILQEPSSAFNEYDLPGLLGAYWPYLVKSNPRMAIDRKAMQHDRRLFMHVLIQAVELWVSGADAQLAETWQAFHARIHAGLDTILAGANNNGSVALFTSGGVIATIMGEVLGLPPAQAVALNWRIHNGSISAVHIGRRGRTMSCFNATGHLQAVDRALITYW